MIAQRFVIALATADLASGQIGAVGYLPAGCVPLAIEADADQLDSNGSPTFAWSVGLLNAAGTAISTATADGGAAWATGQTIGRTSGGSASGFITSRPLKLVTQSSTGDRSLGLSITGSAATAVAGNFAFTLWYHAAP